MQVTRWNVSRTVAEILSSILIFNFTAMEIAASRNISQPFWLANSITTASLDLFRRCFIGCAAEIWNNTQLDHIRSTVRRSWTVLARKMQHVICNVYSYR